jgi:hypothetical protein
MESLNENNVNFENTKGTLHTGECEAGLFKAQEIHHEHNVGLKNRNGLRTGIK